MQETYDYLKKNVILVGLSGAAGSGKDYIAKEYFCKKLNFKNFSLAWHFKVEAYSQGLGTYDEIFNTKPPHIRTLLQIMGTELGRDRFGDDWWTNMTLCWIRHLHQEYDINKWVIPDIRFPNELSAIKSCGGEVWRVISDVEGRSLTDTAKTHASETSLEDDSENFDGVIYNYIKNVPHNYVYTLETFTANIYLRLWRKIRPKVTTTLTYGSTEHTDE